MDPAETAEASAAATVTSGFLGGRLQLAQPERGYRAGMDAALLAAACGALPGQRVIEAGCGAGAALLSAALRQPDARFTGIERDPSALALALANIAANGLSDRVQAQGGDVEKRFSNLGLPAFDAAMANPPFFDDPEGLRGPALERRDAWIADGGLVAWTKFLLKAVREGGSITVIHRADRLGDLLALLGEGAGSFKVRAVQPYADKPAKRVLVRCVKTGKAPLILLPPLIMHDHEGGKHTVEAEAVLRGESGLGWT
jgi:tRNA1(Val) A37 N6-methylase TrmN6